MERVDFTGDSPQARFGHTITPIAKDKAILFGGAVGDTGKYVITGDTFLCDYSLRKWRKLDCHGTPPTNRAAHAAISLDHFFFVFGGALGGGELADDGLYQLDFLTMADKAFWAIKNCKGTSPGARYGHVMAYLKPFIVIFGGNTGAEAVGDIWKIDVLGNCVWEKVSTGAENPPPRVYHSASICRTGTASGMMVIFGGRGGDGVPLNDTWGLRKHRDGRLDWMKAPYRNNSKPAERYQHRSLFVGTLLLILGGRNNQVGEALTLDIYDTDSSDWYKLPNLDRFRHACFLAEHNIYIHGGFDQEKPNVPTDTTLRLDLNKAFNAYPTLYKGLAFELGKDVFTFTHQVNPKARGSRDHQEDRRHEEARRTSVTQQTGRMAPVVRRNLNTNKSIRLCPQAVVANFNEEQDIKKVHIDMLQTQHKKLVGNTSVGHYKQHQQKVHRFFLSALFMRNAPNLAFPLPAEYVDRLLEGVERIVEEEPTLVRVRSPIKIFGDVHGQLQELNRLFQAFGAPHDEPPNGDIEFTNYLFLGDYVDRGSRSVETILLLFALKLKYPENVVLLRGGHEQRQVNRSMGFGDECSSKFKQNIDDVSSFYNRVNRIFEKMPIAALVEDSIFCSHGGIGHTLKSVYDLQKIDKPIRVNYDPKTKTDKIVYELLWSDPCRRGEQQFLPNVEHDYFLTKCNNKYSEDRANSFCIDNDFMTTVRSHEPIMDGFESRESIITIFSCSDYGGGSNKCSILHVMKNGQILPKILPAVTNPVKDRWLNLEEGKKGSNEEKRLRQLAFTPPKK